MKRTPLRLVAPADHRSEPGYREWHAPIWGRCQNCDAPGRLERHHVVKEQHVRREGGDPWDLRNALELGVYCRCHRDHHSAALKISVRKLPDQAIAFASELYGPAAGGYLSRFYGA